MDVPILKLNNVLIASVHFALSDSDFLNLRKSLINRLVETRASGVIIDLTAVDVLDSFSTKTLRDIAQMVQLRGAKAVIAGIHPDVAFSMVQMGLSLRDVTTVLDLEEGLDHLNRQSGAGKPMHAHRKPTARDQGTATVDPDNGR